MARIKWFENEKIVVYIYGELYEKHHERHLLVLKKDEDCQYGFDGEPVKGTKRLKRKADHELVSSWILGNKGTALLVTPPGGTTGLSPTFHGPESGFH